MASGHDDLDRLIAELGRQIGVVRDSCQRSDQLMRLSLELEDHAETTRLQSCRALQRELAASLTDVERFRR